MRNMLNGSLSGFAAAFWLNLTLSAAEPTAGTTALVRGLMRVSDELAGVPFAEVIHGATGRRVIPLAATDAAGRSWLGKVTTALDQVLRRLNDPVHPAHRHQRINEVSRHFEDALREELNRVPGFEAGVPLNAAGQAQRAGYPDLRLRDASSERVAYLDPKVFAADSRTSSLRTFYYEPKVATNKVLEDAHHLLVGFAHGGRDGGQWRFLGWELVDLSKFHVRLKAEFQAANRDLYRDETVVARSGDASK